MNDKPKDYDPRVLSPAELFPEAPGGPWDPFDNSYAARWAEDQPYSRKNRREDLGYEPDEHDWDD